MSDDPSVVLAKPLLGGRVPKPPKYWSTASGSFKSSCIWISAGDKLVGDGVVPGGGMKTERSSTEPPSVIGETMLVLSDSDIGAGVTVGGVLSTGWLDPARLSAAAASLLL